MFERVKALKIRGKQVAEARLVVSFSSSRYERDIKVLEEQLQRAKKYADGTSSLTKPRFVKTIGGKAVVDDSKVARRRELAGWKGLLTNLDKSGASAGQILAAYHTLFQVEASFRIMKSDLDARPMYLRRPEMIQAHITMVMCAVAVCRHVAECADEPSGWVVKALERVLTARIRQPDGEIVEIPPYMPEEVQRIVAAVQDFPVKGYPQPREGDERKRMRQDYERELFGTY
ncbi:hypothetical protein C1Y63_12430 [Corynebacterium sp. 13CS0277]|nr:hypothetical protein C1Y63_12430 [Corynebacterium sp. 13CS0277]